MNGWRYVFKVNHFCTCGLEITIEAIVLLISVGNGIFVPPWKAGRFSKNRHNIIRRDDEEQVVGLEIDWDRVLRMKQNFVVFADWEQVV